MKYIILFMCAVLTGCATKGIVATIFLKETDRRFYNLDGETCKLSGYTVVKEADGKHYTMTTYFKNCPIHEDHQLEEVEVLQWQPSKGKASI